LLYPFLYVIDFKCALSFGEAQRLKELKAMTGVSHGANLAIAHKFPWGKYRTVVDVGTAQGDLITQVALANPHIEGTGFDLPEVGPIFEEYVEANRISGRVRFSPGSFMEHALPKADVVMMGHILHDWNLEIKRSWCAKPATRYRTAAHTLSTKASSMMIALTTLLDC
jgi:hypothetical protein